MDTEEELGLHVGLLVAGYSMGLDSNAKQLRSLHQGIEHY